MDKSRAFLIEHGFDLGKFDNEAYLQIFESEMKAGLEGKPSSLAMIPAFIDLPKQMPRNKRVAVLDAGGTNLRAALIEFDADGCAKIVKIVKSEMPGAKKHVSVEDFYSAFIRELDKIVTNDVDRIGFCFSYPAEVTPHRDAKLLLWTKQIQAPEIIGHYVGAELSKRLAALGRNYKIVILNDTIATLLAGYTVAPDADSYIGFILGTGTNTAYVTPTSLIAKSPIARAFPGQMSINVESGGMDKMPRCEFDKLYDDTTRDPGSYMFEKCLSGVYMGGLGLIVLKQAAKEGLFSEAAAADLAKLDTLSNITLDDFCAGQDVESPFKAWSDEDKQMVVGLCRPFYVRAARLTAVNIAAAIIMGGGGKDPERPVIGNVNGSTYYKTKCISFNMIVHRELDAMLKPRGIHYKLLDVEESPLFGAAIASLT